MSGAQGLFATLAPAILGVVVVVLAIMWFRVGAAFALAAGAILVALTTPDSHVVQALLANVAKPTNADWARAVAEAARGPGERVALAFGSAAGKIGLVVAFACVVGEAMRVTGAARVIANACLRALGVRRAPWGLAAASFALGVPVFFDTLFLLMVPLARALRRQSGRDYLLYILAIVAGGTMAHTLVPPTPGPLFVAEALGVNIVTMIVGGLLVGAVAVVAGMLFAYAINEKIVIPLREDAQADEGPISEHKSLPLWLAASPVLLPLLLIAGAAITKTASLPEPLGGVLKVAGDKVCALGVAALWSLALTARTLNGRNSSSEVLRKALAVAGPVVLITSAGGAFGEMLRQTNIASLFVSNTGASLWLLPLVAAVTTAVRSAQGSATVAMMTAVGMVAGLAGANTLPFAPVYLALAIGCGSKNFAWMNDSGFWVMARTTGMTESETLRTVSMMNLVMAAAGMAAVTLAAWLWPFP